MTDSLSLDPDTVSAQLEVCPEAPERVLACGHEKRTHRTDGAFCRTCQRVQAVMTPERALAMAKHEERSAAFCDDLARSARERAAMFRKFAANQENDNG